MIRLDKFLCQNGYGTRTEVKKLLKTKQVTCNDAIVTKPEMKIDSDTDRICVAGKEIHYEKEIWLMFHKPAGCVTATSDRDHKTVMDFIQIPRKEELFPVGRLDIDTEGLLLFTNNGDMAHRMLSPKHHVEKTYYVEVDGELCDEDVKAFAEGVDIGEKRITLPAKMRILYAGQQSQAELTIQEGKFHQVKRMFAVRGKKVTYLKRISMAEISLDTELKSGEWRELKQEEKEKLFKLC